MERELTTSPGSGVDQHRRRIPNVLLWLEIWSWDLFHIRFVSIPERRNLVILSWLVSGRRDLEVRSRNLLNVGVVFSFYSCYHLMNGC